MLSTSPYRCRVLKKDSRKLKQCILNVQGRMSYASRCRQGRSDFLQRDLEEEQTGLSCRAQMREARGEIRALRSWFDACEQWC